MDRDIHEQFEKYANEGVQTGELPGWLHVAGPVAWYVYMGPYEGLGAAWQMFMGKVHAAKLNPYGPPGDVYVCDPTDHAEDGGVKMLTVMWIPLKWSIASPGAESR